MAKKFNCATIIVGDNKIFIDSDTIADITLKSGVVYEKVRVVGTNMMGDGLRVVTTDGINEIPNRLIKTIKDSEVTDFPGITVTKR